MIFSFIVKPYILWKDINYNIKEIYKCIWRCLKIVITIVIVCVGVYVLIPQESIIDSLFIIVISSITVVCTAILFMERSKRDYLKIVILNKINRS